MTDDHQIEIDKDTCLALTGAAEQCGNGVDTDASNPEAGLCGVHADTDRAKVTDFPRPAWAGLRDDLTDLVRSERDAYALSTLSPDLEKLWTHLTALQDLQIGEVEITAREVCYLAREVGQHPDLDVDDHPFGYDTCIAIQGRSAKNDTCPNGAYGTSLLCGMHQEADLPGTILDEDEPGPDLETVTVDGDEYQLVEQRDEDLIVVNPRAWELKRLEGAAGREPPADQDADREEDDAQNHDAGDKATGDGYREGDAGGRAADHHAGEATADGGSEPTPRPEEPSNLPKYLLTGVEKQSPEDLRDLADFAEQMADWMEANAQHKMEQRAEQEPMETPEEWDDDEWQEAVEESRDDADLDRGEGTLTTKTIDGRDYYYLQWREGSKIKSEYVAPVVPADSEG